MPQYIFTHPETQMAFSNLGRIFSPQAAAQGRLMQAQQGQIDSATALNQARALTEGQRLAELQRLNEWGGIASQLFGNPNATEDDFRRGSIYATGGMLPSENAAATTGEIRAREAAGTDRAIAVENTRGQNALTQSIAEMMFKQQNPGPAEPFSLGPGYSRYDGAGNLVASNAVSRQQQPVDLLDVTRQQGVYNSFNSRLNALLSTVAGADYDKDKSTGEVSLNTEFPLELRTSILKRADEYAKAGEPADSALVAAFNEVVPGGIESLSVVGAENTGFLGNIFDAFRPNANRFTINSPAPAAQLPPANAPVSPSTPQGAAPGAGDSPQNPLPVPMKNGKVDAGAMIRGKYYVGPDNSIIKF